MLTYSVAIVRENFLLHSFSEGNRKIVEYSQTAINNLLRVDNACNLLNINIQVNVWFVL